MKLIIIIIIIIIIIPHTLYKLQHKSLEQQQGQLNLLMKMEFYLKNNNSQIVCCMEYSKNILLIKN